MHSKIISVCKENNLQEFIRITSQEGINHLDEWGRSPLYYALRYNAETIVHYAISDGSDLFTKNFCGSDRTQIDNISVAIRLGSSELEYMLEHIDKLDLSTRLTEYIPFILRFDSTERMIFPLFVRYLCIKSIKNMEALFCRYAKPFHYHYCKQESICFDYQNALKYTALYRKYSCFISLLDYIEYAEQLDHLYVNNGNQTSEVNLLTICARQGFYKGVKELLKRGADPYILMTNKGEVLNILMMVMSTANYFEESEHRKKLILKSIQLFATKLNVNYQNTTGLSALMIACQKGNINYVHELLTAGVDITLKDMHDNRASDFLDTTKQAYGQLMTNIDEIYALLHL